MPEKTPDDVARELLLPTTSEREAHDGTVQALLARNAALRTNDEVIAEQLRLDPEFRAEWERTALGRAASVAMVRYRAEHGFSQGELASLIGMTTAQIEDIEAGDVNPSPATLGRISSQLGIELGTSR